MTGNQIIAIVEEQTRVALIDMQISGRENVIHARYILTVLLHEEGWSNGFINELFKRSRTNAISSLKAADALLRTNKKFKDHYLACIARITQHEDAI